MLCRSSRLLLLRRAMFSTRLMISASSVRTSRIMAGMFCSPAAMYASSLPWPQTRSYFFPFFTSFRGVTVIGRLSPTLRMFCRIPSAMRVLRTRGFKIFISSIGMRVTESCSMRHRLIERYVDAQPEQIFKGIRAKAVQKPGIDFRQP